MSKKIPTAKFDHEVLGYKGHSNVDSAEYYTPYNPFELSEKEQIWLEVEEIEEEKKKREQEG